MATAVRSLGASILTAVPWCCIAPAAFAVSGVAAAGVAPWIQAGTPLLLVATVLCAARAVYLSWFLRRGRPWTRAVVVVSLPLIAGLWLFRFGFGS